LWRYELGAQRWFDLGVVRSGGVGMWIALFAFLLVVVTGRKVCRQNEA
jgi:hypothetical protein